MRLGVLSWKKLKNRETHGAIVSLDQLWSRRLFVMFIAWTSQKGSEPSVSKLAIVIWNIQSPQESSCDSCEISKISTSRTGNDLRQLSFGYRALSSGAHWFTRGVYIWVTHLHIAVPIRNNSYYLRVKKQHDQSPAPTCKLYRESFFQMAAVGIELTEWAVFDVFKDEIINNQ